MNNPNEIQALAESAGIGEYKNLILNNNFAVHWKTLYAKCSMDDQPHLKSMLEKTLIINDAIEARGDLLICFNDFPAPPRKEKNDMRRYHKELSILKGKNVNAYNKAQRKFITDCWVSSKNGTVMLYWQAQLRNESCDAKCFELEHHHIFQSLQGFNGVLAPPNDVSNYVFLTNLGTCKCRQQATGNVQNCEVAAKPPMSDVQTQTVEAELQPETSPRVPGEKRSADVTNYPASEPVCKQPRLTPVPSNSSKFENFAETTKFLDALLRECSVELSKFKTTAELKKLIDHSAMEPFKGILNHKDFVLRWDELHDKCEYIAKAERNMATAAQEIRRTLLKRPCFIQHFSDFPAKPNGTVEDTTRYVDQLRAAMHEGKFAHPNSEQFTYAKLCLKNAKEKLQKLNRINCTI
uniref:SCP domain-containing protein n=1 Tax=Panagrellus redivivus TaxID=6233 RepID=A0A7E4VX14_PANRE